MKTLLTSLSHHLVQQKPAARGPNRTAPAASFQQLMQPPSGAPAAAGTPDPVPASPAAAPTAPLKRLGPFTADPFMHPADPAASAPASAAPTAPAGAPATATSGTPNLAPPQMAPPVSWNPYDQTSHETRMNAWYMNYVQGRNDEKMKIYQMALHDWQINDEIYKNLGMPRVARPEPPALDPVAPMPAGWWMANGNLPT